MSQIFAAPFYTAISAAGNVVSGAKLYFFLTGTLTPQAIYQDAALATPHTNPVVADSAGRFPAIYMNANLTYRVKLTESNDALIKDVDPVNAIASLSDLAFTQSGTGAVSRTALSKMREMVTDADFGAVGDDVADDTAALTNFWNHAIANPGVPHILRALTYRISGTLPVINVSNVWIEGSGSVFHDAGVELSGTVLHWAGGVSAGAMVTITSVSGAANQKVSNVTFKGIGLQCSGGIATGLSLLSLSNCEIDVAVAEATNSGVFTGCVATLAEAADIQRCLVKIRGRQVTASGYVLYCSGTATANTSMNVFEVDAQHYNAAAIVLANSDNNDWRFIRCYKPAGGSAAECMAVNNSNSAEQQARLERIWFLTANTPVHAYGTGGVSPATYPAYDIQIFCLDKGNGTPDPIVEPGATLNWRNDRTMMDESSWIAWTPAIAASTGTLGSVTGASGRYRRMGKRVDFVISFAITTNGTGSAGLTASLPLAAAAGMAAVSVGKEVSITGKGLTAYVGAGGSSAFIQYTDGTYPGVNGGGYSITGFYETA